MVESKNSTRIEEMKIIAHGADGFLLFPTKNSVAEAGQMQALHTHVYYEFFFATQTPLTLVTDTGTKSFTNSVVIVPPQKKHFSCAESKGGYRITVTADEAKRIGGGLGLLDYIKKGEITALAMSEELAYYLDKLVSTDFSSGYGRAKGEALLRLLFLEIGVLLKTADAKKLPVSVNNRYRNIEKIDKFIGLHYNQSDVSIETLAQELCLSVRQVARIIKREYGRTFVETLNDKRLTVAAALLKKSNLSVSDIIKELNFETENYFYRMFKKYYGTTPLKYRRQTQKEEKIPTQNISELETI